MSKIIFLNKEYSKKNPEWLMEPTLGEFLEKIYPAQEWIRDKKIAGEKSNVRPDYRSEKLKLIVEYDGDPHYNKTHRIFKDVEKEKWFNSLGYAVIKIPYFIQLSNETIKYYFGIEFEIKQKFPHGFIGDSAVFPCDYCEIGIEKFKKEMNELKSVPSNYLVEGGTVFDDIVLSLYEKTIKFGDVRYVLPTSLLYLFDELNSKYKFLTNNLEGK